MFTSSPMGFQELPPSPEVPPTRSSRLQLSLSHVGVSTVISAMCLHTHTPACTCMHIPIHGTLWSPRPAWLLSYHPLEPVAKLHSNFPNILFSPLQRSFIRLLMVRLSWTLTYWSHKRFSLIIHGKIPLVAMAQCCLRSDTV